MLKKPTKCRLIWLLFGFLSTACSSVLGCNTTLALDVAPGTISIPTNQSSYCFWKINLSDRTTESFWFTLSFDFTLEDCEQCKCEYVEIWDKDWTKDSKNWVGRFCGDLKHKSIYIKRGSYVYVEYSSSKNIPLKTQRSLKYEWIISDTTPRPTPAPDNDHNDDKHHHHRHDGDHKGSAITATAVGILLSLVFLIGALACGICLVQFAKPKRRRRQRQAAVLQTSVTQGHPKLPHLPNYFENDVALPPPYLETIEADGKPVEPPAYYDNPPPYSILDTESTLETTGDTRATDLMNRRR